MCLNTKGCIHTEALETFSCGREEVRTITLLTDPVQIKKNEKVCKSIDQFPKNFGHVLAISG